MLKELHQHFIADNPAMTYLNVRAWRKFRRWAWLLAIIAFFYVSEVIAVDMLALDVNQSPAIILKFLPLGFLMGWVLIFSTSGLTRLLHKDNVEPLFLTHLAPEQIWGAILINANRNLLILYLITMPIILAPGPVQYLSLTEIAGMMALAHLLANLWLVVFCIVRLQFGVRFGAFLNLILMGGYLVGSAPFLDRDFASKTPFLLFMHPIAHLLQITNGFQSSYSGHMSNNAKIPEILGLSVPYRSYVLFCAAFIGALLLLWLFSGGFRLPAAREEEGARRAIPPSEGFFARLFYRFGRIAELRMLSLSNPNSYTWRYTVQRLYENGPRTFRRRKWMWQNIAGIGWLSFIFLLITEIESKSRFNEGALLSFIFLLLVFAIFGSFRFCFAAQQTRQSIDLYAAEEPQAGLWPRTQAYGAYILILAIIFLFTVINRTPAAELPAAIVYLYCALLVITQILFNIWVSLRSRWPRQALAAGILHIITIVLVPMLVLLVVGSFWGEALDSYLVSGFCSLSPVIPFILFAGESLNTYGDPFTGIEYPFHASELWSMGFLLLECALLGLALNDERKRRRKAQLQAHVDQENEIVEVAK